MKGKKTPVVTGVAEPRFNAVVEAFAGKPDVIRESGKGFGSGSLKVNGKIFAMISSKGQFVVKLPRQRVDDLVASRQGGRFDPGHGRLMKEWLVGTGDIDWVELATEAHAFVKSGPQKSPK